MHRRVLGGEADRRGMLRKVRQPDRFRLFEEQAEHPVPARQIADHDPGAVVDALVDEFGELHARLIGFAHAERTVTGIDQLDGGVHDRTQCVVQVQSGGDDQHRLDQAVHLVPDPGDLGNPVLDFA